jgi:hypothetical protein
MFRQVAFFIFVKATAELNTSTVRTYTQPRGVTLYRRSLVYDLCPGALKGAHLFPTALVINDIDTIAVNRDFLPVGRTPRDYI